MTPFASDDVEENVSTYWNSSSQSFSKKSTVLEKHDNTFKYPSKPQLILSHQCINVDGFQMWHSLYGTSALITQPPPARTIDAKGVLDLQAGAGLLAKHRRHAQHVLEGEHIVVGEHSADSVSERVDLWVGKRGRKKFQCQVRASLGLRHLPKVQGSESEKKIT